MVKLTRAEEPFTKRRVGKHYVWSDELSIALKVASAEGAYLFLTDAPYQVAKVIGDRFKLVIYPHRTTAGNYHLRVRDEGSADKERARTVALALNRAAGCNCTFTSLWRLDRPAPQPKGAEHG